MGEQKLYKKQARIQKRNQTFDDTTIADQL